MIKASEFYDLKKDLAKIAKSIKTLLESDVLTVETNRSLIEDLLVIENRYN